MDLDQSQGGDFEKSKPQEIPAISIVIPVFNSEDWIEATLNHIFFEISNFSKEIEIIVVDDGSHDKTTERIAYFLEADKIKLISTTNQGRFLARSIGVEEAKSSFVLFIDSRVFVERGSITFLLSELQKRGVQQLWNSKVKLPDGLPLVSYFWEAVERIAWKNHFSGPQTISVRREDLDFHPIGTTMFGAPRDWLLSVNQQIIDKNLNLNSVSDDTKLIKELARKSEVQYSPEFSCLYHPRTTVREFIKHAFHRGKVFVDGHLNAGGRYVWPFIWLILFQLANAFLLILEPRLSLLAYSIGLLFGIFYLRKIGLPQRSYISLIVFTGIFLPVYSAGALSVLNKKVFNKLK